MIIIAAIINCTNFQLNIAGKFLTPRRTCSTSECPATPPNSNQSEEKRREIAVQSVIERAGTIKK